MELCETLTSHCSSGSLKEGYEGPMVAYPGHLPLPRNVMVKALCALCEALTKDLKPYWCKQAVALKDEYLMVVRQLPRYRAFHRKQSREIALGAAADKQRYKVNSLRNYIESAVTATKDNRKSSQRWEKVASSEEQTLVTKYDCKREVRWLVAVSILILIVFFASWL